MSQATRNTDLGTFLSNYIGLLLLIYSAMWLIRWCGEL